MIQKRSKMTTKDPIPSSPSKRATYSQDVGLPTLAATCWGVVINLTMLARRN